MANKNRRQVAILYPGDTKARKAASSDNNRFASVFQSLADAGVNAVPVVYHDDFCDDVRRQLLQVKPETTVRVRHARRGSSEEEMSLQDLFIRCEQYFAGQGKIIDQTYQQRLVDGMVRYLVHNKVAGFGHQAVNARHPAPPGTPPTEAPKPSPRLYHPPTLPEFQSLKQVLEGEWIPELQQLLDIDTAMLPVLWDCDFLLGPKDASGEDTYVLCEINVSSVAPFPESALPYMAKALLAQLQ